MTHSPHSIPTSGWTAASNRRAANTLIPIEWPLFVERLDQNPNAQQNLEALLTCTTQR
jgi:hypothetical protein